MEDYEINWRMHVEDRTFIELNHKQYMLTIYYNGFIELFDGEEYLVFDK